MTSKAWLISFIIGVAIDYCLVWLFFWFQGQEFSWTGFWVWQGILLAAGILLWLRRLLGFSVWYLLLGRDTMTREALEVYRNNKFEPFDKEWDNLEGWLSQHISEDRSAIAHTILTGLLLVRQQGIGQGVMAQAAYKKAAIKYGNQLKRRGSYDS